MLPWALQLALLSFAQFHSSSGGDNEPGILLGPAATRNYSIISQAEAVKLMLLGLRDADAIACITHGFKRNSAAAASQLNPVDAVFRMAADMSGCFTSSRALVSASGSPSRIKKNQVAPVDTVSRSTRLHVTAAFCAPLSFAHVLFEQEDERQAASAGAHNTRCCSIM
jgi:hypothetical protein